MLSMCCKVQLAPAVKVVLLTKWNSSTIDTEGDANQTASHDIM